MSCERWTGAGIFVMAMLTAAGAAAQAPQPRDGAELYKRACAQCHDDRRRPRAQPRPVPRHVARPRARGDGIRLDGDDGHQPQRPPNGAPSPSSSPARRSPTRSARRRLRARCAAGPRQAFDPGTGPRMERLGQRTPRTPGSRRPARPGLTAADVPKLKLKWAFAFPGDLQSYSQATIVGGRLFVGSWGGKVYSLNAATGCIHWYFDAGSGRSIGGQHRAGADVHRTARCWRSSATARQSPTPWMRPPARRSGRSRSTTSPSRASAARRRSTTAGCTCGVASGEEASGAVPTYECCKFRGSLVALDAATGKQVWKTYLVEEPQADQEERRRRAALGTVGRADLGAPRPSIP